MITYLPHLSIFIIGLCIGSFLNVCIYRLPLGQSLVTPGSRCPQCGTPIRFYDNIPLLSYILLGGKCRACKSPFSFRYPLVELLSGLLALAVWTRYGWRLESLFFFFFCSCLLAITFIDIDHRIIPDTISLPGILVGLAASFLTDQLTWQKSLAGIAVGGGSLLAVAMVYKLLTGKDGMGGGDIKLLAMIGAFTGWQGVLFTVFVASASGTLVGIIVMLKSGKNMKLAVPFGPFLAIGAITYIFCGDILIRWYLNAI